MARCSTMAGSADARCRSVRCSTPTACCTAPLPMPCGGTCIPINPASGARAPRVKHVELTVWTSDEAATFLRHVSDDRLAALWILALHTGMRRGELAGLRWKDVDLDAGTLTVVQQRTNANHEVVVSTPKAKSQRQIVLAPATVAALRQHRTVQLHERLALGEAWTDTGYVFVDEAGQPYHPHSYLRDVPPGLRPRRRAADPPPRRAPHDGDARPAGRRAPEGRAGAARTLGDQRDDGHLLAGPAGRAPREREQDRRAVRRQRRHPSDDVEPASVE